MCYAATTPTHLKLHSLLCKVISLHPKPKLVHFYTIVQHSNVAPCCKSGGFVAGLPSRPEQKSRAGFGQEQAANCNRLASQRAFTSTLPVTTETNSTACFCGKRKTKTFPAFFHCLLPIGNSRPALARKAGQCSALLLPPWDTSKRWDRSCRNLLCESLSKKKSWTTHVWEEIRKSQQEKEENHEYCQLFALSGRSDPLQMSRPQRYPADTCFRGELNSYTCVILKTRSPSSKGRWAKPPNRFKPSFLIHWVKVNKNFCSGVLKAPAAAIPLTTEQQLQNKHKYKQAQFILDGCYLKIGRIQALYRCLLAVILKLCNNIRLCYFEILFNTFSASTNRQCFIFPA